MSYSNTPRWQQPPLQSAVSSSSLSRISTVSDITDFEGFPDIAPVTPLLGRPSLVSLQSDDEARARSDSSPAPARQPYPGPPAAAWPDPVTSSPGQAHGPIPPLGPASLPLPLPEQQQQPQQQQPQQQQQQRQGRSFAQRALTSRIHHEAILEEEEEGIDLSLIHSAAPIQHEVQRPLDPPVTPNLTFDLSSTLGPTTRADEDFIRALQQQEAQGKLTGGLGLGIRTDAVLTESALLATSPVVERSPLARSFSFSRPGRPLSDTVRQLGQTEANKRGEVIEVVMETLPTPADSDDDLSIMAAPEPGLPPTKSGTWPTITSTKTGLSLTQVFYPQPDWKPFSMRWPYLLFIILLSMVLGGGQEVLYQTSARSPLVTFHTPSEIPTFQYFAFKFLPTLITVSYGVLWQLTNFEVRRLEAFYQLSKETGALAAESINVDYITDFSFLRPIRAFRCGHYAVAVSSIATLLANTVVPTLGAASIILSPDRDARIKYPGNEKFILVHAVWSRLLTVTFLVIALLGCVLFFLLQRRRSGLLGDVKGIAGLASMATVSHILMDFKDMDVATHGDIHHKLKDHRYALRNSSLTPDDLNPPSKQEREKYTKNYLSENPHPLMLRAKGAVPFILGIVMFSALIPVFLFTPANVLTDRAPWVVTLLAVCIKLSWGALETDVRMMEPYYILWRRHAPSKTLTLDYTAMPFGWVALQGLLNRHWLVFFVGFGTVLTELLTVLVTSLATVEGRVFVDRVRAPDSSSSSPPPANSSDMDDDINAGEETVASFWISFALADFVLLYMGVVALVVYVRRRRVFLPRQPNTIASVLAFIHQSKMLYNFVNTAKLSNAAMADRLAGLGKTYGLGWFQGRDGQSHCGVDEEELLSGYKFGYDYSRATKPWEETAVDWL